MLSRLHILTLTAFLHKPRSWYQTIFNFQRIFFFSFQSSAVHGILVIGVNAYDATWKKTLGVNGGTVMMWCILQNNHFFFCHHYWIINKIMLWIFHVQWTPLNILPWLGHEVYGWLSCNCMQSKSWWESVCHVPWQALDLTGLLWSKMWIWF